MSDFFESIRHDAPFIIIVLLLVAVVLLGKISKAMENMSTTISHALWKRRNPD